MTYILTTKIRGNETPVGIFETFKEASDFHDFAYEQSSFDFEIYEAKEFKNPKSPADVLNELNEKYNCWNQPSKAYIENFEGYKQGE